MDPSRLSAALALRELGWNVVPAPLKGKAPIGSWKRWQTERLPERSLREAFARADSNLFIITGKVSKLAVLDCDTKAAVKYWREKLGEVMEQTTRVRTGKGHHFYFRLADGQTERGRSLHDGDMEWDLRCEGNGVVAPPSVHESGREYAWVDKHGPEALQDAPAALFDRVAEDGTKEGSPRSLLTHLLTNVPAEGGRNNWLAKVAGHYALHIPHQDAFETLVREAAAKLAPPLPEEEIAKLVVSIWRAERAKEGKAAPDIEDPAGQWRANLMQPAEESGWLVSGGTRILAQIREKKGESYELGLASWLDCDIRVLGVVESENEQIYSVQLLFPDGAVVEDHLPSRVVSDPRQLHAWLASHGASIGAPDHMHPYRMRESTRLLRYLKAQGAEAMIAAEALGWHWESEAFITHEGVIRPDGPGPFEHVRPDPSIRGWAPYRYGHGGREKAQDVLAEVLNFHDETVASVFGAWWAACLLKPQIQRITSQFPFMALEASSESGKTTGFFPLMMQLSGNTGGQSNPTRAALRDYLSAHHNGIVWVDDLDDLDDLGELLRNVTVGGSMVKKGDGNHAQVVAHLRAALVVSGESLGLQDQKALVDRAVLLDVPSPTERRSAHGDRPQWDDIVAMRETYRTLTDFSGSLVELALAKADEVKLLKTLRQGSGRHADTIAIVRVGARILAGMLNGRADWVVEKSDRWAHVATRDYSGKENVLTLKLIPRALRNTGWRSTPEGPMPGRTVATPSFVDNDNIVWFSPKLLAEWWEREPPTSKRLNPRVESARALEQQARELGLGGRKGHDRKDFRLVTGEGSQRYWRATPDLSAELLERSRGEDERGE